MAKKSNDSRVSGLKGVAQIVAQEERKEMQYTEFRGHVYWFRRRAPEPLKPGTQCLLGDIEAKIGKNGYVRLSLETNDKREAGKKARKLAHFLDEAAGRLSKLKAQQANPQVEVLPEPTREEILHAADSMYAMFLAADDDMAERSLAAYLNGEDAEDIREPDRFILSSADLPPHSTAGQMELLEKWGEMFSFYLHLTTGKSFQRVTPSLLPFADAFRRYFSALEKRKAAEVVLTPPLPTASALTNWSWDDAFSYYLGQRAGLADSTIANYKTAWTTLADSADCAPGKLTTNQVVTWRDHLLTELGPRTVKSRLTFAGAIWRESRVNGKIDRATINPFEGLRVKVDENAGSSRGEFTPQELSKIFSAAPLQTARAVSVHAGYWLPLLALYHGARLEELTGMEVADIEDWKSGLILHIRENTIRPRLKHRKKSERSIPAHPKLLELGFGDYVKAARSAGVQALFPSFARGATFGEGFATHVKQLLSPTPGRLVGMHCFRHNWETARRSARLDTSASNYATGRRLDKGSSALYGGPAGLAVLNEELSKIVYGLRHLPAPAVTPKELKAQERGRQSAQRPKATNAAQM
ncbi:MAG: hypothetical protein ACYCY7_00800 [Gallionella sp.]